MHDPCVTIYLLQHTQHYPPGLHATGSEPQLAGDFIYQWAVQCDAVRVALERAVWLCLQDGLSRYLLNGCGDGFPKWWLLKAIAESQLSTPDNSNACENWVRPTIGSRKRLHRLQVIGESWKQAKCHALPLR